MDNTELLYFFMRISNASVIDLTLPSLTVN